MNRAIARKPLFELPVDVRYLQSRLALAARRGDLQIHAWCVLTTHFHLLVRSPAGRLSDAMRRVQNDYARWFNRRTNWDGAVFRGRFRSKRIDSVDYLRTVLRYIDLNSVKAKVASHPCGYIWSSAHQYATRSGPSWLERGWVESYVRSLEPTSGDFGEAYRRFARVTPAAISCELAEGWLRAREIEDPRERVAVEDLHHRVHAWLRQSGRGNTEWRVELPACDVRSVRAAVAFVREPRGDWSLGRRGRIDDGWFLLEVCLLRCLASASWKVAAAALGSTPSSVARAMDVAAAEYRRSSLFSDRLIECARRACRRPGDERPEGRRIEARPGGRRRGLGRI